MFTVVELQTDANGNTASIATSHATELDAKAKYHTVLAAAAQGSVAHHACCILNEDGFSIACDGMRH